MRDLKTFDEGDFAFRNSKGKVKPAPQLPADVRVADTHCHLGMLPHPASAIARAAHYGFGLLVCVCDPAEEPEDDELTAAQTMAALDEWMAEAGQMLAAQGEADTPLPCVRFAVGVHPHNARRYEAAYDELVALLADPRTCCLGEIGLDYHYDLSPRDVQRDVFARQLRLAHETGLPVALHLREAHEDALQILRAEGVPRAGCILHCFNLDAGALAPFLELGCHIAFGGPLTFRKSWYTRLACTQVPVQLLLTETDAPYMAPEPLRGTLCEPAQSLFTLRTLLDCYGYAGQDAMCTALQPRAVDIEAGAEPVVLDGLDAAQLQRGLDEAQFCDQLYANAAGLLDRAPTSWQTAQHEGADR